MKPVANDFSYQLGLLDAGAKDYWVREVLPSETHWLLLKVHYAKRIPSISHAYGLFHGNALRGVVTYGTPAASTLRSGIAGDEYAPMVLELNRLCLVENLPNEASRLVGASLRLLPAPKIVVSFADTAQGHEGIIYQATNFLYTGLSAKRTNWKVEGMEHLHGQTIADITRNATGSRVEAMRAKFGDKFYLEDRSRKHRYIFFVGNKHEKRKMLSALRYPVREYPRAPE